MYSPIDLSDILIPILIVIMIMITTIRMVLLTLVVLVLVLLVLKQNLLQLLRKKSNDEEEEADISQWFTVVSMVDGWKLHEFLSLKPGATRHLGVANDQIQ